jgi:alcohol dehydrogenase class IV
MLVTDPTLAELLFLKIVADLSTSGLSDIGINQEHLDTLACWAVADFTHPNNPKPLSRADFRALYAEAL